MRYVPRPFFLILHVFLPRSSTTNVFFPSEIIHWKTRGKELFVIHRLTDRHSAMQPCSDLFICFIFLFVLVIIVPPSSANTECVWAIGQLKCDSYPDRLANTVVEIWDEDGSQRVGIQTDMKMNVFCRGRLDSSMQMIWLAGLCSRQKTRGSSKLKVCFRVFK